MTTRTGKIRCFSASLALGVASGCASIERHEAALPIVQTLDDAPRPPYRFSDEEARFLNDVQLGAFNYLWNACDPITGMVFDRSSITVISVGGVGFQLSALPIGVERGWITRAQGEERAIRILRSLRAEPSNRKQGLYYHYLDPGGARPSSASYERVVSTIDSALLLAGALTAGSYFGGATSEISEEMWREVDWRFFVPADEAVAKASERGYVSLGWKPSNPNDPTGAGELLPYYWVDSGDEHRLVTFLGVCAPEESKRLPPEMYYRLRRALGSDEGNEPFVWFPWSGALFTAFFAHCWIDYTAYGPDDPSRFGLDCRPRVDWWENSRRIVAMHRHRALANPEGLPTFGTNAWGLTACDAVSGYLVPGIFPKLLAMPGCEPENDFSAHQPQDHYGDGTIAPYGAGCAIVFEPAASMAALKYYRSLTSAAGGPLVWRDPGTGGYGFQDSFNLGTGWVAPDCVAIDQGPLILSIENARTGKVWGWFGGHPSVQAGKRRLGWRTER